MGDTSIRQGETSQYAYERGMQSAVAKAKQNEERYIRAFGEKLMSHMSRGIIQPDEQRSTPGTFGRFARAAEHIVSDIDPTNAATPHGIVALGNSDGSPLAQAWVDDSLRAASYATLIESDGNGIPQVPIMSIPPTAGPQVGEKQAAYSQAFDITASIGAPNINSTLHLNISGHVNMSPGTMGLLQAIMRSAVASEASAQIVKAITDGGTDATDIAGGFGTFDGSRFAPTVVLVPPSELFNVNVTSLAAAGIAVAVEPAATQTVILSPQATIGWFLRMQAQAAEPSAFGYGVSFGIVGTVSVDPSGVAVVPAGP